VEVKPSFPCRRFAACKRSLNVTWELVFRQNYRILFSSINFHILLLVSLASRRTWRHLVANGNVYNKGEQGSTTSLKAAVQPGHWLRALNFKNNNNKVGTETFIYVWYHSLISKCIYTCCISWRLESWIRYGVGAAVRPNGAEKNHVGLRKIFFLKQGFVSVIVKKTYSSLILFRTPCGLVSG
jgi:hypothetical protein